VKFRTPDQLMGKLSALTVEQSSVHGEQTNVFAQVVDTRRRWANSRVRLARGMGRRAIGY